MSPADAKKLLGGWAAGTLTDAERQALLAAALEDQDLFNDMMAAQPLKELLDDPAARAELLSALDERPGRGLFAWLFRPWPLAAAGTLAALVIMTGVFLSRMPLAQAPVREKAPAILAEQRAANAPVAPPAAEKRAPARRDAAKTVAPATTPERQEPDAPAPQKAPDDKREVAQSVVPAEAPAALEARSSDKEKAAGSGVVGGAVGGVMGGILPGAPQAARTKALRGALADGAFQQPFVYQIEQRKDETVVAIEALRPGYLQVFERAADASWKPLGDRFRVAPGQRHTVPATGKKGPLQIRFSETVASAPAVVVDVALTLP